MLYRVHLAMSTKPCQSEIQRGHGYISRSLYVSVNFFTFSFLSSEIVFWCLHSKIDPVVLNAGHIHPRWPPLLDTYNSWIDQTRLLSSRICLNFYQKSIIWSWCQNQKPWSIQYLASLLCEKLLSVVNIMHVDLWPFLLISKFSLCQKHFAKLDRTAF